MVEWLVEWLGVVGAVLFLVLIVEAIRTRRRRRASAVAPTPVPEGVGATKLGAIVVGLGHHLSARGLEDIVVGHPLRMEFDVPDELGGSRYTITLRKKPIQVDVH